MRRRQTKRGKRKDSKTKKKEHQLSADTHELVKRKTVKLKGKSHRKSTEPPLDKAEEDYFRRIEEVKQKIVLGVCSSKSITKNLQFFFFLTFCL